jgi:hypothetical protein
MTVNVAKQAQQLRFMTYGPQLVGPNIIPPTVSTTLWTVSGGNVAITSLSIICTVAMSATATTLNIGCFVAGSSSATNLLNAGTLTSIGVGASVATPLVALTAGMPALTGAVIATAGAINWIASATQTGQCQVYLSYIPIDAGAAVG